MAAPLLASLLTLGACTNTDDFNEGSSTSNNEIAFSNPFINKTTRSTGDIKDATALQKFKVKVWGEKYASNGSYVSGEYVFNGTDLTYNTASGKWEHNITPAPKWETGKDFDFVGFAPANTDAAVSYSEGKVSLAGVPLVQHVTNDNGEASGNDYLLSNVTTSKSGYLREEVSLSFNHILSRLSVYTYTTLDKDVYQVKINSLSLYLPNSTLTASYAEDSHNGPVQGNDTWTWTGFTNGDANASSGSALEAASYEKQDISTTAFTVNHADVASKETANKFDNKDFFVAPTPNGTDVNFFIAINYTITKNATTDKPNGTDQKTYDKFVNIAELKQLKQGYQHNLFIGITPTAIKFDVKSVNDWEESAEGNGNFVDNEGHSFSVSSLREDTENKQLTGVIDCYGNTHVGSSETAVTYALAELVKDGTSKTVNQTLSITDWYDNAACQGTPASTPSQTNRYGKFVWDYSAVSHTAGTYTLKFRNTMNDIRTLDFTLSGYTAPSAGNGGLSDFGGVDM